MASGLAVDAFEAETREVTPDDQHDGRPSDGRRLGPRVPWSGERRAASGERRAASGGGAVPYGR